MVVVVTGTVNEDGVTGTVNVQIDSRTLLDDDTDQTDPLTLGDVAEDDDV
jgi:hypothetical protein